ncbi:hypothetical protein SAY86_021200 [Trapa natans]|uniref:SLL1 protein n=1 Tax=Trapa natans TaxID=22666 RepID=A0AAN7M1Q5_TRANT|nr:hypothetical protein SAY86_021200 [Trapa natans]
MGHNLVPARSRFSSRLNLSRPPRLTQIQEKATRWRVEGIIHLPTMAMNNAFRSASKLISSSSESLLSRSVSRGIHSTGVKRMGGGHGHDEPYYLHAKHMYNLDRMKNQGLKMTLAVFTAFSIGVGVPVYAVIFQQKKTASA